MSFMGHLAGQVLVTVRDLYKGLNPATLTGCIDVIVVRRADGSLACSPFHVRFGKLGVLSSREKVVDIEVNGFPVDLQMKLGDNGEAFFVLETDEGELPSHLSTSPIPMGGAGPLSQQHATPPPSTTPPAPQQGDPPNAAGSTVAMEMLKRQRMRRREDEVGGGDSTDEEDEDDDDDGGEGGRGRGGDGGAMFNLELSPDEEEEVEEREPGDSSSARKRKERRKRGFVPSQMEHRVRAPTFIPSQKTVSDGEWSPTPSPSCSPKSDSELSVHPTGERRTSVMEQHMQWAWGGFPRAALQHRPSVSGEQRKAEGGSRFQSRRGAQCSWSTMESAAASASATSRAGSSVAISAQANGTISAGPKRIESGARIKTSSSLSKTKTIIETSSAATGSLSSTAATTTARQEKETAAVAAPSPSASPAAAESAAAPIVLEASVKSSLAAAAAADQTGDVLGNPPGSPPGNPPGNSSGDLPGDSLGDSLGDLPGDSLGDSLGDSPSDPLGDSPSDPPGDVPVESPGDVPVIVIERAETAAAASRVRQIPAPQSSGGTQTPYGSPPDGGADCRWDSPLGPPGGPRIALSLCGGLSDTGQLTEERFRERRVAFLDLCENPELLSDPQLVVKIGNSYYNWAVAAPILLSVHAFGRQLPQACVDRLVREKMSRSSYRWWFSWGRRDNAALESPGRGDVASTPSGTESSPSTSTSAASTTHSAPHEDSPLEVQGPPQMQKLKPPPTSPLDTRPPAPAFRKTLRLSSQQLASLGLRPGANEVRFSVTTPFQGTTQCQGTLHLWDWDSRVIISDIDGTITKSDALGQILPTLGKDWTHEGIARLFHRIHQNGYKFLYCSARAIGMAHMTRGYLQGVREQGTMLPRGPLLLSPSSLFAALHREVIEKKPERFKIECLRDIGRLFHPTPEPFYAAFGNRANDVLAYREVGVAEPRIFTVNPRGELVQEQARTDKSSYGKLHDVVDHVFPRLPTAGGGGAGEGPPSTAS
ncbi:phosphatidate phosphatase LPIN1-like [Lampetra fluviatilis]